MAAKLRSILKQIHWSLLLRAAIFALAWFFLPFWLFVIFALYLYFVPPFQAGRLLWPFLALLVITFAESPNLPSLIIFCGLFYYLLLIKDLLVIDRRSAYEVLVFVLSFLLLRDFYRVFNAGLNNWGVWYAFLLAVLLSILTFRFMASFSTADPDIKHPVRRVTAWLVFLISWQFLILGMFLPLDFIYQSVIVFLVLTLIIDFASSEYLGDISRSKTFSTSIAIFTFLVIILASAYWGL